MTEERHDDEVLGRALARAIETQYVSETPYERSRLAARPARGGMDLWQLAGSVAVLGLAIAIGFTTWSARPTSSVPVAASPSPSGAVSPTPAATSTAPAVTATPVAATPRTSVDHAVVYFARDGLPPVATHFPGMPQLTDAAARIRVRLTQLWNPSVTAPRGAYNAAPPAQAFRDISDITIAPNGDVTVDVLLRNADWGVRGAAQSNALLQQLVYTATEEPGVQRVLITQDGGKRAVIDQLTVTRPLAREDVFGYSVIGPLGFDKGISVGGPALPLTPRNAATEINVGTRVLWSGSFDQPGATETPAFVAWMAPTQDELQQMGKYVLTLVVGSTSRPTVATYSQPNFDDQTPLRATRRGTAGGSSIQQFVLDDARPWRVYIDAGPGATAGNIVVEIGGDPRAVSDRITVTAPLVGMAVDSRASRTFKLAGTARVFEANVVWRLKDSSQRVIADGHTTASIGTSPLWGTYSTEIAIPTAYTGNVTLEVFEASAKDGTPQGVVAIPIAIR